MRYFLRNFKDAYNKDNPFGFFPDWEHYPATGAHLHAVLHKGARVAEHYRALKSREDFLALQKSGDLVDCYEWFCTHASLKK